MTGVGLDVSTFGPESAAIAEAERNPAATNPMATARQKPTRDMFYPLTDTLLPKNSASKVLPCSRKADWNFTFSCSSFNRGRRCLHPRSCQGQSPLAFEWPVQ